MKVGDLIRHKRTGDLALVIKTRGPAGEHDQLCAHEYIDFVWVDETLEDSAWFGHFEVISESR